MTEVVDKDVLDILADPNIRKSLGPYHSMAYARRAKWLSGAFNHQKLPQGTWWSIWLMLAGRGAGKTRTAADSSGGGHGRTPTPAGWYPLPHRWTSGVRALRVSQVSWL